MTTVKYHIWSERTSNKFNLVILFEKIQVKNTQGLQHSPSTCKVSTPNVLVVSGILLDEKSFTK